MLAFQFRTAQLVTQPLSKRNPSFSKLLIIKRCRLDFPFCYFSYSPAQKPVTKTTLANPTNNRAKTLQSKKPGSRNPLVNNAKIETLDDSDDSNDDFVDVASEPAVR